MWFLNVVWDYEPDGNVEHIDEHDLTPADVEYVLQQAVEVDTSDSTGRPCVFGYTPDGERIIVVFEWVNDDTILPITAYEVEEPFDFRLQQVAVPWKKSLTASFAR